MHHISKDLEVLRSTLTDYLEQRKAQRLADEIERRLVWLFVSGVIGYTLGHLLAYITM